MNTHPVLVQLFPTGVPPNFEFIGFINVIYYIEFKRLLFLTRKGFRQICTHRVPWTKKGWETLLQCIHGWFFCLCSVTHLTFVACRNSLKNTRAFSTDQLEEISRLVDSARILLTDPLLYKLNLLLTLTRPQASEKSSKKSPMGEIYLKYETLMRRRIEWMCNESSVKNHEQTLRDVFSSLNSLNRFSQILRSVK